MASLPLQGRRICITRSRTQASVLGERLEELGAHVILLPTIEIASPESFAALDGALWTLPTFNWLVLTSTNAVEAMARRAEALRIVLRPERVAAIGPATAGALERAGIRPRQEPGLLPATAVAESLLEALLPRVRRARAEQGSARMLLVRAAEARDVLPEGLTAAGAEVTIAAAYRTVLPESSVALLPEIFANRDTLPDAITFTSSSTVSNLVRLLGATGTTLPEAVRRISIGPVTSATLRELGLAPCYEAARADLDSLVEAICAALPPVTPGSL